MEDRNKLIKILGKPTHTTDSLETWWVKGRISIIWRLGSVSLIGTCLNHSISYSEDLQDVATALDSLLASYRKLLTTELQAVNEI